MDSAKTDDTNRQAEAAEPSIATALSMKLREGYCDHYDDECGTQQQQESQLLVIEDKPTMKGKKTDRAGEDSSRGYPSSPGLDSLEWSPITL